MLRGLFFFFFNKIKQIPLPKKNYGTTQLYSQQKDSLEFYLGVFRAERMVEKDFLLSFYWNKSKKALGSNKEQEINTS